MRKCYSTIVNAIIASISIGVENILNMNYLRALCSVVQLAERLRKKIEMHETHLTDKSIRVTASLGVANLEKNRMVAAFYGKPMNGYMKPRN
jgi:GGDEF domain-containing protein